MVSTAMTLATLQHTHITKDRIMKDTNQWLINNIINKVMEDEGYESYDEVDSLTTMTIITDIEDHFDINLDLNILEGVSGRTELVARLMEAI